MQFPLFSIYSVAWQNFLVMNSDLLMVARSMFKCIRGRPLNGEFLRDVKIVAIQAVCCQLPIITITSRWHFPATAPFLYSFLRGCSQSPTLDLRSAEDDWVPSISTYRQIHGQGGITDSPCGGAAEARALAPPSLAFLDSPGDHRLGSLCLQCHMFSDLWGVT